jgi:hypothetical protein
VIGPDERRAHPPADGADIDDAAARNSKLRQERLRDPDLADHVDLQLTSQVVQRQELQRPGNGDAGVVDKATQARATRLAGDGLRRRGHGRLVRHIDDQRRDAGRLSQLICVRRLAHASEDTESHSGQPHSGRPPNARRSAGDHHRAAGVCFLRAH